MNEYRCVWCLGLVSMLIACESPAAPSDADVEADGGGVDTDGGGDGGDSDGGRPIDTDAHVRTDGGGTSSTQSIGPGGGTIVHDGVILEVPRGALTAATEITIATTGDAVAGYDPVSPVYRFEPEGLRFAVAAHVTIEYTAAAIVPAIYWSAGAGVVERPSSRTTATEVAADIDHFSLGFVAAAGPRVATRDVDENGDGVADERVTYTYDSLGRTTEVAVDTEGGCIYARRDLCPAYGGTLECELSCDETPDGVPDARTRYDYDSSGNPIRESVDSTGSCTTVSCTPCYGECCSGCGSCYDGSPVEHRSCRADGVADRTVRYSY